MEVKLKRLLFIFILLQPFLDIFWLYQPPLDSLILGMSPATIIRLAFVLVIGIMYLLALRHKKELWFYAGYILLLGVYFIFHQQNAGAFHSLVPGNFGYSTFGELFYLVRMLIPLFMIIVSARSVYTDSQFEHLVNWLTLFFSGSIVLTNLLGISLGSYIHRWGKGNWIQQYGRQRITGTIFNWFVPSKSMDFYGFASKGFFNHANTTGTILILLTPLVLYVMIKHFNWQNITLAVVHALACIELGTKAAGYGVLGILAAYAIIYLFFAFVMKEFRFKPVILVTILLLFAGTLGLNHFSPTANRQFSEEGAAVQLQEKKKKDVHLDDRLAKVQKSGTRKQKVAFVKKYRKHFGLNPTFVEHGYSYRDDPDFWLDVMTWPTYSRMNYRYLQMQIWKRVDMINANRKDRYLGFGYTRLSNMGLIERDFVSQYYALGLVGMLLVVAPYLLILALCALFMLAAFKRRVTLKSVSLFFATGLMLGVSLYAGYVLDYLTATILLGFFIGQLIQLIWPQKDKAQSLR